MLMSLNSFVALRVQCRVAEDNTMSHIESERDGAVQRIAINRPDKKNALTADMYDALSTALEQAEADDGVRVILLHAKGAAFTAGNDLEDFLKKPWKEQAGGAFHSRGGPGQEAHRGRRPGFGGRSRHHDFVAL
jgi:enoyl-CoA hydratase/carnithine racemase